MESNDGASVTNFNGNEIPTDILDDLCSRFIINVPEEERKDLIRLCFQIELAHWFYLDFYSRTGMNERKCGIREFAYQIFKHIPYLQPYASNIEGIIDEWKGYKLSVPTFGAILVDETMTNVLLVKSYCSKSSWGFPKGKINKDEPPCQCAIREVYEETGFNIQNLIQPKEYIEAQVNEQLVRLYVVPGVSRNENFAPKTRYEIKAINWFPLMDLPATRKEACMKLKTGTGSHSFFMVAPFVRPLRQWIFDHDKRLIKKYRRPRIKSCGDLGYFPSRDYPNYSSILKNTQILKRSLCIEKVPDLSPRRQEEAQQNSNKNTTVRNITHNENSCFVEVPTTTSQSQSGNTSALPTSAKTSKLKPIPFKEITLSESFLKNGISAFANFKLNWDWVMN